MNRLLRYEGRPIRLYGSTIYSRNSTIAFICRAMGTTPNPNSIKNLVKYMRATSGVFKQWLDEILPPTQYALGRRRDLPSDCDRPAQPIVEDDDDMPPGPIEDEDHHVQVHIPQPEPIDLLALPADDGFQLELNLSSLDELRQLYKQRIRVLESIGQKTIDNGGNYAGTVQQIVNTIYRRVRDAVERNCCVERIGKLLQRDNKVAADKRHALPAPTFIYTPAPNVNTAPDGPQLDPNQTANTVSNTSRK